MVCVYGLYLASLFLLIFCLPNYKIAFDVLIGLSNPLKLGLFTIKEFSLFDFKSILPRFQQRQPLIVKTSQMECNKVIPLVLDKNRLLFFILSRFLPTCLQQQLAIIIQTSKIQRRIVIPQLLDENRCLFLILSRFLHVFSNVYQ